MEAMRARFKEAACGCVGGVGGQMGGGLSDS